MVNQKRVRDMAKMAMFDQKDGRRCKPMTEYFRKDYVSKEMIKSIATGTLAFLLILAVLVLWGADSLADQLNSMDIRQIAIRGILCYAGFLGVYLFATYMVYNGRYTRGRLMLKKYFSILRRVNRLYRQEEEEG